MSPSVSAEVNHHYLSFDGVELKVQRTIPTVFNPLPVRSFIPFTDETNDCSVMSKFNDGVQSLVCGWVHRRGLSTLPWWEPVLRVMVEKPAVPQLRAIWTENP